MKKSEKFTRRKFFPLLGSSFLIPFVASAMDTSSDSKTEDEAYEVLLKPDGSTVKVKKSVLSKAEKVNQKLSNSALLGWLKK
ncbi:MAG: hypothetical protein KKC03_07485 [Bacteroidetes bacterium]|nr:hypothetical protein [Bacteroidota bacterium]